jgi:hypothetical protein
MHKGRALSSFLSPLWGVKHDAALEDARSAGSVPSSRNPLAAPLCSDSALEGYWCGYKTWT